MIETCILSIKGTIYFRILSCRVLRVLNYCIFMIGSSFLTVIAPPVYCCLLTALKNIFLVFLIICRRGLHNHILSSSLISSSNLRTAESVSICNLKAIFTPFFNFSYWNTFIDSRTRANCDPRAYFEYFCSFMDSFQESAVLLYAGSLYSQRKRDVSQSECYYQKEFQIFARRDFTVLFWGPQAFIWSYDDTIINGVTLQYLQKPEGLQLYRVQFLNFYKKVMKRASLTGKIMFNRYLVGACIGYGSFGQVYLVYDTESEQIYAMKAEQQKIKNALLVHEAKILKLMSGERGFVSYHHYGYEAKFNCLVMGLLGPSLEDLFNACNRNFSLKTILMLAEQIINRLETLHSKNFVYRDVKPQNFLMGLHQNSHVVHLVDFGLSKKYRDIKNHQHIPYKQNRSLTGTVRYSSINSHLGIEYSRRDDLQAVGYMLQYFFNGSLPWQGFQANTNLQKYSKILLQKQTIPIQLQFSDMPIQFCTYMHYCRSLKFTDRPDYTFIRKLFTDLMDKLGYTKDYIFDWCLLKHTVKLENGTMSLSLRNRFTDLESPYVTFYSGQTGDINLQEINLNIGTNSDIKEENGENGEGYSDGGMLENVPLTAGSGDGDEGNIGSEMMEDSDLKLISHRNKWYQMEL